MCRHIHRQARVCMRLHIFSGMLIGLCDAMLAATKVFCCHVHVCAQPAQQRLHGATHHITRTKIGRGLMQSDMGRQTQLTQVCQTDETILVLQPHPRRGQQRWFHRIRDYNVVRLHPGHCSRGFGRVLDNTRRLRDSRVLTKKGQEIRGLSHHQHSPYPCQIGQVADGRTRMVVVDLFQ